MSIYNYKDNKKAAFLNVKTEGLLKFSRHSFPFVTLPKELYKK
jgi:hypothetical protein